MTTIELGKTYESESNNFRDAWNNGRVAAEQAHNSANSMVRILKQENDDWAIHKILSKIAADHEDLQGFSIQNLYKYLDKENSKMLQTNDVSREKQKNSKKDTPPDKTKEYEEQIKRQQEELKQKDTKINELEDAFHQITEKQFVPATKLQTEGDKIEEEYKKDTEVISFENQVFEFLEKKADGTQSFWYPNYGIGLFQSRILTQLKNSGVKTFKRLYFEV